MGHIFLNIEWVNYKSHWKLRWALGSIYEYTVRCLFASSSCLQKLIEDGVGGNNLTSYLDCVSTRDPREKIFGKKKR